MGAVTRAQEDDDEQASTGLRSAARSSLALVPARALLRSTLSHSRPVPEFRRCAKLVGIPLSGDS